MTTIPVAEPPPRESLGRRLSTFFYRHPRVRLWLLLALEAAVAVNVVAHLVSAVLVFIASSILWMVLIPAQLTPRRGA